MLLSFELNQTSIASVWGTPWLNWAPFSTTQSAPLNYQYINQANLTNNVFSAGEVITLNYSPVPWNNTAAPTNVQLFSVSYPLLSVPISTSVAESGGVNTITITNMSGAAVSLNNAQVTLNYQGQFTSSIWGSPWAAWTVSGTAPNYTLYANASASVPAGGNLIIAFTGSASAITNVALMVPNTGGSGQGSIVLTMPGAPTASAANPIITVTGPSYPSGQKFTGVWGQPLSISLLQLGSYSFSTPRSLRPQELTQALSHQILLS